MKKTRTWILVADGGRARIFCNDGPGHGIKPVDDNTFKNEVPRTHDIVSDRQGRVVDLGTHQRHAMAERYDPHEYEEREFMRYLANYLDQAAGRSAFDRLVLVAPPRALGNLREFLTDAVKAKVSGELNKDLTKTAIKDLPEHLGAVLAV